MAHSPISGSAAVGRDLAPVAPKRGLRILGLDAVQHLHTGVPPTLGHQAAGPALPLGSRRRLLLPWRTWGSIAQHWTLQAPVASAGLSSVLGLLLRPRHQSRLSPSAAALVGGFRLPCHIDVGLTPLVMAQAATAAVAGRSRGRGWAGRCAAVIRSPGGGASFADTAAAASTGASSPDADVSRGLQDLVRDSSGRTGQSRLDLCRP